MLAYIQAESNADKIASCRQDKKIQPDSIYNSVDFSKRASKGVQKLKCIRTTTLATIDDKIKSSNGVTSKNKRIHTPSLPLKFRVFVCLFSFFDRY